MATFEEIAELASDINQKLYTNIRPDSLVYLIEEFIEDDEKPFTEIPIWQIAEQVKMIILMADAFLIAQDGEDVETIEAEVVATDKALTVKQ